MTTIAKVNDNDPEPDIALPIDIGKLVLIDCLGYENNNSKFEKHMKNFISFMAPDIILLCVSQEDLRNNKVIELVNILEKLRAFIIKQNGVEVPQILVQTKIDYGTSKNRQASHAKFMEKMIHIVPPDMLHTYCCAKYWEEDGEFEKENVDELIQMIADNVAVKNTINLFRLTTIETKKKEVSKNNGKQNLFFKCFCFCRSSCW